ncbi:Oberon [Vigna unguiculata]|uniref:Oberon n=1 Tax=Vigna unguiculata TaxID=3917 RepID=A0A4D6LSD3_VIGUN|nr:Oberon [Vigna unguiculata]
MKNNRFSLFQPVAAEVYGEGFPYAPESWPEKGDVWGWRTGRRVVPNGNHFQDRYLYLPNRLLLLLKEEKENPGSELSTSRKQHIFASKLAVKSYLDRYFPDADLNVFFSSFSWKIPAISASGNAVPIAAVPLQQIAQDEEACDSMPCDICCSEPLFCRACCCMLCGETVCADYGGYSYVKCQVNAGNGICGHVTHVECALRCSLAGKVEESVVLDAEYHCRRCDGRTDMISHVNNLLQTCKSTDLHDQIVQILNLGSCLLRGSEKPAAKELLRRVELTISKLKFITNLEDIWKEDESVIAHSADNGKDVMDVTIGHSEVNTGLESHNFLPLSLKLEAEVDEVLQDFRKSQELEYKVAEETLQTQKTYLQNLYRQLEYEKSVLAGQISSSASKVSSSAVRERKKQIKRELDKFEMMKKVANGFSRTPHSIIKKHFLL